MTLMVGHGDDSHFVQNNGIDGGTCGWLALMVGQGDDSHFLQNNDIDHML